MMEQSSLHKDEENQQKIETEIVVPEEQKNHEFEHLGNLDDIGDRDRNEETEVLLS